MGEDDETIFTAHSASTRQRMAEKPFKGIIREWYRDGDVICGICEYHPDAEVLTVKAVFDNGLVQGHPMHTSRVIKVEERDSFAICETRNSFYVLIYPRMTEQELLRGLEHLVPQPPA